MKLYELHKQISEVIKPPAAKRTVPETASNLTLIHGSNNSNLSLNDVEIVRSSGQKQGKKGRVYGGFYATSEEDVSQAENYAKMSDGEATLYNIKIKNGTKIYQTDSGVTRLSPEEIKEMTDEGYGILVGKDPLGSKTEWVIIDKNCIASISPR